MNELQQVLNNIKQDKNTNLLPGNLRDNVTCLGVEGTAEVPETIYKPSSYYYNSLVITDKVYFTLYVDDWFIYSIDDSRAIVCYYNNNKVCQFNRTRNYNAKISCLKLGTDYIIIIITQWNERDNLVYKININGQVSQLNSINVNSYYSDNYFTRDGNLSIDGDLCRYDEDTQELIGKYSLSSVLSTNFRGLNNFLYDNLHNNFSSYNTITKYTYNSDYNTYSVLQASVADVDGVTYNGDKIVKAGNIYQLGSNLEVGSLLKSNALPHLDGDAGPVINWIDSSMCAYNGVIYNFDDDNNTFTPVDDLPVHTHYSVNSAAYIYFKNNNTYILLKTEYSDVEVGYNYKGNYFPKSNIVFNSGNILQGNTYYTDVLQPVAGTMPNNGELNITPTTENQNIPEGYTSGGTVLGDENLKSENIKKDVSIFGVTGSLEPSSGQIKLFETVEEMQLDNTSKEGDLAVVYRNEVQNMTVDTQTQYITFPETVILPEAFTGDVYCMLRAVDETVMFDGQVMLSQSMFDFNGYTNTGMIRVRYISSNGITYNRDEFMGDSGNLTNPVDFGTTIQVYMSEEWNDSMGYFMQIGGSTFEGLYEYASYIDENYIQLIGMEDITFNDDNTMTVHKSSSYVYNSQVLYDLCTKIKTDTGIDGGLTLMTGEDGNIYFYTICKSSDISSTYSYALELYIDDNGTHVYPSIPESTYGSGYDSVVYFKVNLENNTYEQLDLLNLKVVYWESKTTDNTVERYISDTILAKTVPVLMRTSGDSFSIDSFSNLPFVYQYSSDLGMYEQLDSYTGEEISQYLVKTDYRYADTQLTLSKSNELLPGIIGYGKNGTVVGDNSLYSNLEWSEDVLSNCPTDVYLSYINNPYNSQNLSIIYNTKQKANVERGISFNGSNLYILSFEINIDKIKSMVGEDEMQYQSFDINRIYALGNKLYIICVDYNPSNDDSAYNIFIVTYDTHSSLYTVSKFNSVDNDVSVGQWLSGRPVVQLTEDKSHLIIFMNILENTYKKIDEATDCYMQVIDYNIIEDTFNLILNCKLNDMIFDSIENASAYAQSAWKYNNTVYFSHSEMRSTSSLCTYNRLDAIDINTQKVTNVYTQSVDSIWSLPRFNSWMNGYRILLDNNMCYFLKYSSDRKVTLSKLNMDDNTISDLKQLPITLKSNHVSHETYDMRKEGNIIYLYTDFATDGASSSDFYRVCVYMYNIEDSTLTTIYEADVDEHDGDSGSHGHFVISNNHLYLMTESLHLEIKGDQVTPIEVPYGQDFGNGQHYDVNGITYSTGINEGLQVVLADSKITNDLSSRFTLMVTSYPQEQYSGRTGILYKISDTDNSTPISQDEYNEAVDITK